ncbi:MAG: alanine racemase, partial [Desulfobulbaceae bacterium]|nr:alanine racemase [Desulfobulbaceae bacterium]
MIGSCNCVEISRAALRHNFELCRDLASGCAILAMIKADGYGHGMIECARIFSSMGASGFGVAETAEGIALREAGITSPIFIFTGLLPEMIDSVVEHDLRPVIVDEDCLSLLSAKAESYGRKIEVHIKVDAGMGRQGCGVEDFPGIFEKICALPGLEPGGVLAHFPMSDELDNTNTSEIFQKYYRNIILPYRKGRSGNCIFHIANSGAIFYFPDTHLDMVRPGLMLYGYYPDAAAGRKRAGEGVLLPAMRFTSRIIQLRRLESGVGLGYGHTAITHRKTTLALLPVGYANGYLRSMSSRAEVLIQ